MRRRYLSFPYFYDYGNIARRSRIDFRDDKDYLPNYILETTFGNIYTLSASSGHIAPIEAGAPDDEITPAMIEAGAEIICGFVEPEGLGEYRTPRDLAEKVWRAMNALRFHE